MALDNSEHFLAAQKANVDAFFALNGRILEGVEKLVNLNLQILGSSLAATQENARKALDARDPPQWLALQAGAVGPFADRWQAYGREFINIASSTQAGVAQVAQEQYDLHSRRVQTLIGEMARGAPAGCEAAISAWKSAIGATSAWYDSVQKTGRQALLVAEDTQQAVAATGQRSARTADGRASAEAGGRR
ncbi:TIGR01841 family phasin (plasmid) [Paraburkholderia sp. DD10]|uniref:TIGR01841 family phasin n=1 Tax=Paraburkholderia sp. DD10 TaxID=3409691 RepID=UPI003B9F7C61